MWRSNEVTRQAATIAYLHDFTLMALVTLCAAPLVFLLRGPKPAPQAAPLPAD